MTAQPRHPSPLGGRKPTPDDLAEVASHPERFCTDDLLPADAQTRPELLIVGINPGLWTAAVNAHFARPGNRFWPSLHRAGLTSERLDVSRGMSQQVADDLVGQGLAITNLVDRPTARADELTAQELREAGVDLLARVARIRPRRVAIAGITAFRTAYRYPRAQRGLQTAERLEKNPVLADRWDRSIPLWVVPQPSGLNAHDTVESLAAGWQEVMRSESPRSE